MSDCPVNVRSMGRVRYGEDVSKSRTCVRDAVEMGRARFRKLGWFLNPSCSKLSGKNNQPLIPRQLPIAHPLGHDRILA